MTAKNLVWLITGCSTGFGREIAKCALQRGYCVAATARDIDDLDGLLPYRQDRLLSFRLDVTDRLQISEAVSAAEKQFGRIDVLVNNAGIGYFGAIEESVEEDVRNMFEINFWGLANVTREVLPIMRKKRRGFIVNLSSIGGVRGAPGVGYYNGSKFAVEGFSEALAAEVTPLGIQVMLVEPSGFRTDWAGRSALETSISIDDYAETAGARRNQIRAGSGRQPGDPARAAEIIVDTVVGQDPPLRLLLGKMALKVARAKVQALNIDFEKWASISKSADFLKN